VFLYSISMYCFNQLLQSGDISLKAAMRFARSVGFQAIEMLDLYWDEEEPRDAQADVLRAQASAEAVSISCYTIHNDLGVFDEKKRRALVDRMLSDVDTAVRLGAPTMRVEASWGPARTGEDRPFEEYLESVAGGLKEVARRAAEEGVQVGLENHGRFMGTSPRVLAVIEKVNEDNFGSCLDIGNWLVVDEDPCEAVSALAPYAKHVHAKDMHLFDEDPGRGAFPTAAGRYLLGAVLGEGCVDVTRCLDIIAKAGYSGAVSLEFEGPENSFAAISRAYGNLVDCTRRLPLGG